MNRTGGGLLAMVLLIAFFTGGGLPHGQSGTEPPSQSGSTSPLAAKAKKKSNATHTGEAQSEATEAEKGFKDQAKKLNEGIQQAVSTSLSKTQQERIDKELGESSGSLNLGFMIAIAPDPVQTHLSLSFDRYIDAIQEAIQASCFDFDRAVLPWDAESHDEDANPLTRETEQRFSNAEQEMPGVLIFRKHHEVERTGGCSEQKLDPRITRRVETLLVFVVGEMPTAGIERAQFLNALEMAKHFTPSDKETHKRPLLILGPNFSGSLYSLQQLLIPETAQFAPITIASGEIEGKGPVDQFEASLRAAGLDAAVNFASFLESSAVLEKALFRYACSEWKIKPSEFAIFSETETAYGGQPVMPVPSNVCPGLDKDARTPVALSFPRGIYHVRTAYSQQFPDGVPQGEQRPQPRSNLKLNLEEPRSALDSVPDFSSQSAVSQDAVLMGVVDDLQKHRSQMLVVLSSDPLDALFLVRYLREHYAYGRLVVIGPDSLLRHESDDPQVRGVLSISAYSLAHTNGNHLDNTDETHPRISFPDDGSEANYNAALVLTNCLERPEISWCSRPLGDDPTEIGKDPLPLDIPLVGYADPSFVAQDGESSPPLRPQIHLDALGREGFWPVATLPSDGDSTLPVWGSNHPATPCPANTGRAFCPTFNLPLSWKALVVAALAGLSFFGLCVYRATILSSSEPEVLLGPAGLFGEKEIMNMRAKLIGFLCLVSFAAFSFVLWPMFSPYVETDTAYLLLVIVLLFSYGLISATIWKKFEGRIWAFHVATVAVLGIALLLRNDEGFRIFLFHSAQVGSQLSPILPVVLAVLSLLWWSWYSISGCVLTDCRKPQLPALNQKLPPRFVAISEESQQGLNVAMSPWGDKRIWRPAAAVLALVLLLTFPARAVRSLEPKVYDYALIGILLVSFYLLLECTVRVTVVWMDLKRLLRSLDTQPFRHMIPRVGGFSWTSIWKIGSGSLTAAHCLLVRQIDALRKAEEVDGLHLVKSRIVDADRATAKEEQYPLFPAALFGKVWNVYIKLLQQKDPVIAASLASQLQPQAMVPAGTPVAQDEVSEARLLELFQCLQKKLADAAARLLGSLDRYYQEHPEMVCELETEAVKKLKGHPPETAKGIVEYYVCTVYINFIVSVLLRIRTLAAAAVGIYVLDVLALNAYPFEPRAILHSLMFGVFAALTACFALVYGQMHRDPILSRITDTNPGELGADFWVRMLTITGVPLASLLASEFPAVGDFLFSWIEPITKALR